MQQQEYVSIIMQAFLCSFIQDLDRFLKTDYVPSIKFTRRVMRQLCLIYIFVIFIIFRHLVEALETVHNHRIIHRYSLSFPHAFIFHLVALNLQTSSWWNVMMMNWISGWVISPYHVYFPQERNSHILMQGLLFYLLLYYSLPPSSTALYMVCIKCHLNNLIPLLLFHSGTWATTYTTTIFISCRYLCSWGCLRDVTHWRVWSILLSTHFYLLLLQTSLQRHFYQPVNFSIERVCLILSSYLRL